MGINAFALGRIPLSEEFARAKIRIPEHIYRICLTCHRVHRRGQYDRVVEWPIGKYESGSDKIGDFTWHGGTEEVLVTSRIIEILKRHAGHFKLHEVQMWQDPRLKKPGVVSKNTKPQVWMPYTGPPIFELEVTSFSDVDMQRGLVNVVSTCPDCGDIVYDSSRALRLPIRFDAWDGSPIFRTHQFDMIFVTEDLLNELKRSGVTNWAIERGAVIVEDYETV